MKNDSSHGRFGGTPRAGDGSWKISRKDGFIQIDVTDLSSNKAKIVMNPEELQDLLIAVTDALKKTLVKPSIKDACACKVCYVCHPYGKSLSNNYEE